MNTRPLPVVAFLSLLLSVPAVATDRGVEPSDADATWTGWRGPERTGRVAGDVSWPSSLAGLEPVWTVDGLGPSYSGPIVTAERVFTTETRDAKTEVVTAFDRASGERLWTASWPGAIEVPFFAAKNGSWIRSTPATDGERLFVGGIREVLVALDVATGEERWRIDFPKRFGTPNPPFGFVSSPLVDDENGHSHVIVEAAGSLFKLDAATGEVVWRAEGFSGGDMTSEGSFSSPVVATLHGVRQLVVQTRQDLRGVDLADGSVLWRHEVPSFRGMNILTPTVWNDHVFTSSHRNGSYLYRVAKSTDGGWSAAEAWRHKAHGYMSSPVLLGDVVYLHLGNGRVTALDLEAREELWTTTPFGSYWSMATDGEKILALDSEGELFLVGADPAAFRLLDRREIADAATWAHLAVAGDEIVVRSLDAVAAWRWKEAEGP